MTVRERPEVVVHDRSNNMIVAFAAIEVLTVIALLGIAAIVGATYVLSNNYNNPPPRLRPHPPNNRSSHCRAVTFCPIWAAQVSKAQ